MQTQESFIASFFKIPVEVWPLSPLVDIGWGIGFIISSVIFRGFVDEK